LHEFPDREILGVFAKIRGILSRTGKFMITIRTPEQLGEALRAARKVLGMTQSEIALVSGVGLRFVVELERGKPTLQLGKVLRVIDSLGGEVIIDGLPIRTGDQPGTLPSTPST
jgi:HTH-type transcriptional regulator/antitoxin HipB